MSSPVLSSQNVIITTAMAISGAVIFLSLARIKNLPSIQKLPVSHNLPNSSSLRSCLSSGTTESKLSTFDTNFLSIVASMLNNLVGKLDNFRPIIYTTETLKGKNKNKKNKKKKVKFAEDVKVKRSETIYEKKKDFVRVHGIIMPGNRAALYHGILRDRVHRIGTC